MYAFVFSVSNTKHCILCSADDSENSLKFDLLNLMNENVVELK